MKYFYINNERNIGGGKFDGKRLNFATTESDIVKIINENLQDHYFKIKSFVVGDVVKIQNPNTISVINSLIGRLKGDEVTVTKITTEGQIFFAERPEESHLYIVDLEKIP